MKPRATCANCGKLIELQDVYHDDYGRPQPRNAPVWYHVARMFPGRFCELEATPETTGSAAQFEAAIRAAEYAITDDGYWHLPPGQVEKGLLAFWDALQAPKADPGSTTRRPEVILADLECGPGDAWEHDIDGNPL